MSKFLELFLFPSRIGNAAHGFCVVFLWLLLILLTADIVIYGPLWLSGNLEGFMRGAG